MQMLTAVEPKKLNIPNIHICTTLPSQQHAEIKLVPIIDVLPNWNGNYIFSPESLGELSDCTVDEFNNKIRMQFENYFDNLQAIFDHFVLADMGASGKGLIARKDITAGTKLLYSGYVVRNKNLSSKQDQSYQIPLISKEKTMQFLAGNIDDMPVVIGNDLANFFQHLPDTDNTSDYNFTADVKKIATANFTLEYHKITDNLGIIFAVAKENVPRNRLVGFDYRINYWHSKKIDPLFFDQQGHELKVVPYTLWHPAIINFANLCGELSAKADGNIDIDTALLKLNIYGNELLNIDTKIIDELSLIGNGAVAKALQSLFEKFPDVVLQHFIKFQIDSLKIAKDGDVSPLRNVVDINSAFYKFMQIVSKKGVIFLDNIRKQTFERDDLAEQTRKLFAGYTSEIPNLQWKIKKESANHFTFWTKGKPEDIRRASSVLNAKRIEHVAGPVKGDTTLHSIQIRSTRP